MLKIFQTYVNINNSFFLNFQSLLCKQFIAYQKQASENVRYQQPIVKLSCDLNFDEKTEQLVNDISENQNQYKNKIESTVQQELFQQKKLESITDFSPKQFKEIFDKLKKLFDHPAIKVLFEQKSLYRNYQQQFQELLKELNSTMNTRQKNDEDVFDLLNNFKEYLEEMTDHLLIEEEFNYEIIQLNIQQNAQYQKVIIQMMVDRYNTKNYLKIKN